MKKTAPPTPVPYSLRSGFTLIELLVVVVTIAILVGITIPVITKMIESSRESKCAANLRQIATALMLYVGENDGHLPRPTIDPSDPEAPIDPTTGTLITSSLMWSKALSIYLPSPHGNSLTARQGPVFNCPSANYVGYRNDEIGSSYFCTAAFFHFPSPTHGGSGLTGPARRFVTIEKPSKTILVSEGKQLGTGNSCRSNVSWNQARTDIEAETPAATIYLDFRHRNAIHLLFADGHIEKRSFLDRSQITRPNWEGRNY